MTTNSHPIRNWFWPATVNWLRAFDEALHHDPTEVLHRRIEHLEAKLQSSDSRSQTASGEDK